jgi:type III restriction enzyme
MLYEKEEKPNGFELKVINEVAQLPNISFWHRNIERKGFGLNGWINHYPDFIIYTESRNLILLETKGDDRDNSDSAEKLKLGKKWEAKCGSNFKYFMVFESNSIRCPQGGGIYWDCEEAVGELILAMVYVLIIDC